MGFSDGVVEAFVKGGREVGACENELSGNESRVKRRAHAVDKNLRVTPTFAGKFICGKV